MSGNPLEPIWIAQPGRWDADMAAHLMRRVGFGPTLDEIDALVSAGPRRAVDTFINYQQKPEPPDSDLSFGDLTAPVQTRRLGGNGRTAPAGMAQIRRKMTPVERRGLQALAQSTERVKLQEMKLWWLDRMVRTQRPLEEKMTLFWHGLFVSAYATVRNAYLLYQQNQLFRANALGNFHQLTLEVSKNPAMLIYLNNNDNKPQHPNENYARELMELFTMGIGNYTETDIKQSARAFTGWTNRGDQFVALPAQHDNGDKTFLGRTGNFNGDDIVNIIFQQPATSKHIAQHLIMFFGLQDAPPDLVASLARVVVGHRFEIAPVLSMLFSSQWFYSTDVMQRQIKSPIELVVGALRALGVGITQPSAVDNALHLMGQDLFNAPTVKGWDGGRAWINTSTLFARYNLPAYLGTGRLPSSPKGAAAARAADVDRSQYADFNTGWDPQIDLARNDAVTTDAVVDLYLKKLLCFSIDPRKREELITYLNGTGDARSRIYDPLAPGNDQRLRSLVHLIMAMAEYQLC